MSQNDLMLKIKRILVWTMWGLVPCMLLGLLLKASPSGQAGVNCFTFKIAGLGFWGVNDVSTTAKAVWVLILIIATSVLLYFRQSYFTLASYITAMVAFILSMSINGTFKGYYGKVGVGVVFLVIFAIFYFIAALGLLGLTVYRLVRIGMITHRYEIYPYEYVLPDVSMSARPQTPAGQPGNTYAGQPGNTYTGQPGNTYAGQPGNTYAGQPGNTYAGQPGNTYAGQSGNPYAQPSQPSQPSQPESSSQGGNRFCTECGAPNPADSKFCSRCGKPM